MSEADRERWNQRYAAEPYDFTPPEWLIALAPELRPSRSGARALDLACGGGRNSLFLAELGYAVDAWDVSDVALELLRAELARRRLVGVRPKLVDLEEVQLPADAYDFVLDAHYLDRRLFDPMQRALKPGGLLLIHTFLQPPTRPYNPAHALEPGELRQAFADLTELDFGEDSEHEVAWLLAQRPSQS